MARFLFVCGVLLLFANVAFAGGEYQPTKDGKTIVWNGYPRSGESADWWGGRDREDYATGFGTLTWFTRKGTVYARYFGNMVRGKFEGPVNVHSKGRTGHAFFVDGARSTRWATGPAPSRMAVPEGLKKSQRAEVSEQMSAHKPEVTRQRSEVSETAAPELAPGQVRPIEHVGPKSESRHKKTSKRSSAIAEKPAVREKAKTKTAAPTAPTRNAPERKETDDFIKSLLGPPSSLRSTPAPSPSASPE